MVDTFKLILETLWSNQFYDPIMIDSFRHTHGRVWTPAQPAAGSEVSLSPGWREWYPAALPAAATDCATVSAGEYPSLRCHRHIMWQHCTSFYTYVPITSLFAVLTNSWPSLFSSVFSSQNCFTFFHYDICESAFLFSSNTSFFWFSIHDLDSKFRIYTIMKHMPEWK